jgi:hypothetical protein
MYNSQQRIWEDIMNDHDLTEHEIADGLLSELHRLWNESLALVGPDKEEERALNLHERKVIASMLTTMGLTPPPLYD